MNSQSSDIKNPKQNSSFFNKDQDDSLISQTKSQVQSKDISLSKLLLNNQSTNKRETNKNQDSSPDKLSRQIVSETEIVKPENNDTQSRKDDKKKSTVIKKFDYLIDQSAKAQQTIAKDTLAKNLQLSTFKKLSKQDPAIQSMFKNSTIISQLGNRILKKNKYDNILKECKSWNKKYTDPDFPPDDTSLSKNWDSLSKKQKVNWKKFVWRRAEEIFGADYQVFFQSIEPNDIKQGQLGDCYLLSSLSSLAERPHVVKKIFQPDHKCENGLYSIWLNVNGAWTNIIVDDYFPCLNDKGGPAFSRANGNELWVLLLEKAYAKVFGSYHVIEGGNPAVALRDITGAPYENKDEGTEEELWEYIQTNDKAGF